MTGRGSAGFTLIELLIAIALLSMLTVLAYGAVQFGNLSWRHADAHRDADADRAAIRRLLAGSISSAYPAFASTTSSDRRITFNGSPDALELVAPLPEALSPGIMAAERFALGRGEDQSSLIMSWNLDLPAAKGGSLPSQAVRIARSVSAIRFAYFGPAKEEQPPAWSDHWSGMNRLPEMVRVRVWHAGETAAPWVDFLVETRTTTNVACVYDAVDPICRRLE